MGEGLGIGEIVDGNELDVGIVERSSHYVAADASKTVDANFNCHLASRMMMKSLQKRVTGWGQENVSREREGRQIGAADLHESTRIKRAFNRKVRKGNAQRARR